MAEAMRDTYRQRWNAREYLRQYYSTPITADDAANTRFAVRELRGLGRRFGRALEFGCGPTVHHVLPLVPFVDQLTLADFLPENLDEVRLWLASSAEAFDWDTWLSGTLAIEDETRGAPADDLPQRKALMRRVASRLVHGDILRDDPTADGETYDLVASYYCLECVGIERADWAACLARLTRKVSPGGVLLMGALRRTQHYHVFDREFPVATIDESDFAAELPRLGFSVEQTLIEVASVPEFSDQGFDAVCCVRALKAAPVSQA
jgi:hypothetical protein